MDINDNCEAVLRFTSEVSDFEADYQLIQNQYAQYCEAGSEITPLADASLWQSLIELVQSGFNHLETNYELLLAGEIGAIYVVALIPLLLGLVLEITLVVSHRRKESRNYLRHHQTTLMTQGRVAAEKLLEVNEPLQWVYRGLTLTVIMMHIVLVLLFIVAVPEYDKDVWCEEHKTQNAILKAGMETERLQNYQKRANCEIRKAVVLIDESVETLGNVFSKENKSTVSTLKQVVARMSDSAIKLDSTKTVIDGFQIQLEKATSNTEDVLKTLLVMERIAEQVGADQEVLAEIQASSAIPHRNLPDTLRDIEGMLSFSPDKNWYLSNMASKSDLKKITGNSAQQAQALKALAVEQALMKKKLDQLQGQIFSQEMVNTLADKVAEKVKQQVSYPMILSPLPVPSTNP